MGSASRVLIFGIFVVLTACASQGTSAVGQESVPVRSGQAGSQPPALEPAAAPVWKVGDEWSFQYESSSDKGTFVDVVSREETADGIECYVVSSARSEFYYRKGDLAYYLQKNFSAKIIRRYVPPHSYLAWPLSVGKQWQETVSLERPQSRETEELRLVMRVEATESITVPAGTFDTFKIIRRNNRTGQVDAEFWYAPSVRYFVRFRQNDHLRELTKFTLQPWAAIMLPLWLGAHGRRRPTLACWTCGREVTPMRLRGSDLERTGWKPPETLLMPEWCVPRSICRP